MVEYRSKFSGGKCIGKACFERSTYRGGRREKGGGWGAGVRKGRLRGDYNLIEISLANF